MAEDAGDKDRDHVSVRSSASRGSDRSRHRLGLLQQQRSVLQQLQEVTTRWRQEKQGLLQGFEEERAIWQDTRRELEEEVQQLGQKWATASADLLRLKAQSTSDQERTAAAERERDKLKRVLMSGRGLPGTGGGFTDFDQLASTRGPRLVDQAPRLRHRAVFWHSSSRLVNAAAGSIVTVLVFFFLGEVRRATGFSTRSVDWSLLTPGIGSRVWPPSTASVVHFHAPLAVLGVAVGSAVWSVMVHRSKAALPLLQCAVLSAVLYVLGRLGLWLAHDPSVIGGSAPPLGLLHALLTPSVAAVLLVTPPFALSLLSERRPAVVRLATGVPGAVLSAAVWLSRSVALCFSGLLTLRVLLSLSDARGMATIVRWSVPTVMLTAWFPDLATSLGFASTASSTSAVAGARLVLRALTSPPSTWQLQPDERTLLDAVVYFHLPLMAFTYLGVVRLWTAFSLRRGHRALASVLPTLVCGGVVCAWVWFVTLAHAASDGVCGVSGSDEVCGVGGGRGDGSDSGGVPAGNTPWLVVSSPAVWITAVAMARAFKAASPAGFRVARDDSDEEPQGASPEYVSAFE